MQVMKRKLIREVGWKRLMSWVCLTLLGTVFFSTSAPSVADGISIIAHPDVSDQSLSSEDVRAIFTGDRTRWDDGNRITLVLPRRSTVREKFLADYVRRTDSQFTRHWRRIAFTGRWQMPREFSNEEEIILYVADTPGAVSFIGAETPVQDNIKKLPLQ